MSQALIFKEVVHFFESIVPRLHPAKSVCAAVSGGCDSIALFHVLSALREKLGIARLGIAHVNHRLRGAESDADAAFVKDLSLKAGASFHEKILGPRPRKSGMEDWARQERYTFFNSLCKTEGYDYIATGHTADDQAETVLMRIMRGCGLKGLCAIAPVREDRVIRPLLHVKRALLSAWCIENNFTFREDSSNQNKAYKRNKVRHDLLPALSVAEPLAAELLPRIADSACTAWQLLSRIINKWNTLYVVSKKEDQFSIEKTGLVEIPLVQEAVAEVLRQKRIRFDKRHVEEIISNAQRTSGTFLLPGGWRYRCGREIIEFSTGGRGRAGEDYSYDLPIGATMVCESANVCIESKMFPLKKGEALRYDKDNMTVFLDADAVKGPLEFRHVKPDDAFQPLGCGELRNVKEFLKKRKKNFQRQGIVSEKNGKIIWIPGIQISHHCRVTPPTTSILKFSCKYIQ